MDGDRFTSAWLPFDSGRGPADGQAVAAQAGGVSLFLGRDLSDQAIRRPPEPVYGRADMTAAEEKSFAAGREAGLAEAEASRAALETETLREIAARMADGRAEASRVADEAAEALARALVAAMRAVMPELIRRTALGEAGAMLAHVLPGLSREPRVHVEVPSAIADGVAAMLAGLALEDRGHIEVAGSNDLASGEARVRWAAGQALREPDRIWRTVMDSLEPALGDGQSEDIWNDD